MLATIERDLPDLRILLVSGEACPHNLVVRWHRPGRTILNAYGPTEATVTATLTELYPDKPVTIGGPLPTYTIVILDEHEDDALVDDGAMGEIGIAGIGLAAGYLNRRRTSRRRSSSPISSTSPNNPSQRIYRTGDLGRINDQDEVEFLGRIDTQVKIRGYRIELTEIESVLMQMPQIAQAVVNTYEFEPGAVGARRLLFAQAGRDGAVAGGHLGDAAQAAAALHGAGLSRRAAHHPDDVEPQGGPQEPAAAQGAARLGRQRQRRLRRATRPRRRCARALTEVMKIERVSVEDNFFQDLGAHSLLMARFCSEIRKQPEVGCFDAGHLPQPDHRQAREPSGHADRRGRGCDEAAAACIHPLRPSNTTAAAPCSSCTTPRTACSASG